MGDILQQGKVGPLSWDELGQVIHVVSLGEFHLLIIVPKKKKNLGFHWKRSYISKYLIF